MKKLQKADERRRINDDAKFASQKSENQGAVDKESADFAARDKIARQQAEVASERGQGGKVSVKIDDERSRLADATEKKLTAEQEIAKLTADQEFHTGAYERAVASAALHSKRIEEAAGIVLNLERQNAAAKIAGAKEAEDSYRRQIALHDFDKERLSSVGGQEAERYVREANLKEAKAAGFDSTFGTGFDRQKNNEMESKSVVEANLATTLNFKATLVTDRDAVVEAVAKKIIEGQTEMYRDFERMVDKRVMDSKNESN